MTAPVVGARTPEQLAGNLGALDVELSAGQTARLDTAGAIELGYPHDLLASDFIRAQTAGGSTIEGRRGGAG